MAGQTELVMKGKDAGVEAMVAALNREIKKLEKGLAQMSAASKAAAKAQVAASKEQLQAERALGSQRRADAREAQQISQRNMTDMERLRAATRRAMDLRRRGHLDDAALQRELQRIEQERASKATAAANNERAARRRLIAEAMRQESAQRKLVASTQGQAAAQKRVNAEFTKTAVVHSKTFGANAVSSLAAYGAGVLSITRGISSLRSEFAKFQEKVNEAAQQSQAALSQTGALAQLTTGPEKFKQHYDKAVEIWASGATDSLGEAAEMVFKLVSAGAEDEIPLYAEMKRSRLISDPGLLARSSRSLQANLGEAETGDLRAMASKASAASKRAPAAIDELLEAAARGGTGAGALGITDEELLSATTVASIAANSADMGGTKVASLLRSIEKINTSTGEFTGKKLIDMVGAISEKKFGGELGKDMDQFFESVGEKEYSQMTLEQAVQHWDEMQKGNGKDDAGNIFDYLGRKEAVDALRILHKNRDFYQQVVGEIIEAEKTDRIGTQLKLPETLTPQAVGIRKKAAENSLLASLIPQATLGDQAGNIRTDAYEKDPFAATLQSIRDWGARTMGRILPGQSGEQREARGKLRLGEGSVSDRQLLVRSLIDSYTAGDGKISQFLGDSLPGQARDILWDAKISGTPEEMKKHMLALTAGYGSAQAGEIANRYALRMTNPARAAELDKQYGENQWAYQPAVKNPFLSILDQPAVITPSKYRSAMQAGPSTPPVGYVDPRRGDDDRKDVIQLLQELRDYAKKADEERNASTLAIIGDEAASGVGGKVVQYLKGIYDAATKQAEQPGGPALVPAGSDG